MADRFAALMQKPIPQKAKRRAINKPKLKGAVDVDVNVVEVSDGQTRAELLNKVRKAMVVKTSPAIQQPVASASSLPEPSPAATTNEMKGTVIPQNKEMDVALEDSSVVPDIVEEAIAESTPQPAESKLPKGPTKVRLKIKKTGKKN